MYYRQSASHLFKVKELRHMVDIFTHHGDEVMHIINGKLVAVSDDDH